MRRENCVAWRTAYLVSHSGPITFSLKSKFDYRYLWRIMVLFIVWIIVSVILWSIVVHKTLLFAFDYFYRISTDFSVSTMVLVKCIPPRPNDVFTLSGKSFRWTCGMVLKSVLSALVEAVRWHGSWPTRTLCIFSCRFVALDNVAYLAFYWLEGPCASAPH